MLRAAWKSSGVGVHICDFDGTQWNCSLKTVRVGNGVRRIQANSGSVFTFLHIGDKRHMTEIGVNPWANNNIGSYGPLQSIDELYIARCGSKLYTFTRRYHEYNIVETHVDTSGKLIRIFSSEHVGCHSPIVLGDNVYLPSYIDEPAVDTVGLINVGRSKMAFAINDTQYICGAASETVVHTYEWHNDNVIIRDIRVAEVQNVSVNNVDIIRDTPIYSSAVLPGGNIVMYARFEDRGGRIRLTDMRSPGCRYELPIVDVKPCDREGLPEFTVTQTCFCARSCNKHKMNVQTA